MDHSLCTCFPQEDNYRSVVSHTQTHRAFERSGFPRKHAHTHSHARVRSHSFATDGEPVQSEPWLVIPLPDHDTLQDGGWSAGLMVWGPAGSHRPIGRSHFVPESTDQPCRSQAVCHSISDETVTIGEGQAARSTPSTRRKTLILYRSLFDSFLLYSIHWAAAERFFESRVNNWTTLLLWMCVPTFMTIHQRSTWSYAQYRYFNLN